MAILGKGLRTITGQYSPQRRGDADKSSTVLLCSEDGIQRDETVRVGGGSGLIEKLKQGLIMRQHWSSFMYIYRYIHLCGCNVLIKLVCAGHASVCVCVCVCVALMSVSGCMQTSSSV